MKRLDAVKPTPLRERMRVTSQQYPEPILPDEPAHEPAEFNPQTTITDLLAELSDITFRLSREIQTDRDALNLVIGTLQDDIDRLRRERTEGEQWPELMSRRTAAAYLDVSPSTLDDLVAGGHVTATIPRGLSKRHYRKADLDAFIAEDGVPW